MVNPWSTFNWKYPKVLKKLIHNLKSCKNISQTLLPIIVAQATARQRGSVFLVINYSTAIKWWRLAQDPLLCIVWKKWLLIITTSPISPAHIFFLSRSIVSCLVS
jgi:hypothetical protein